MGTPDRYDNLDRAHIVNEDDLAGTSPLDDLVIGMSPCGALDSSPRLMNAVSRGGGLGVLDLGNGGVSALQEFRQAVSWSSGPFGVRVSDDCGLSVPDFEQVSNDKVNLVVLTADSAWKVEEIISRHRVLVEVTSRSEAGVATDAGAHGLIARGMESGGRASDLSTFILLQQLLADERLNLPVWAAGGLGPRTAVACVVGGAAGVVLDSQLSLMPESDLPDDVLALLRRPELLVEIVRGDRRGVRRGGGSATSEELVPIGSDGWLAKYFAERWPDATAAVRAIRSAVVEELRTGGTRNQAAASSLADDLGVRLPIAQGPMTRVSDQASFAAAVAAEGAMPFIALALADPDRSARMLREAAAALGEKPWGVGILGFIPDELRVAQIRAILEVKPRCAIIAGGRPAHARELEKSGISTFLHVPAPELLQQFLRAGARKFVFEGAECGGHIGPRSSFSLWESQLGILEEYCDREPAAASQIQVFFAGGLHDARSSAMVTAMAGPFTRRGGRIGMLMGTAYLFTDEAVEHGAIRPLFRQKAIAAQETALLETAPGHVTRCLRNDFADEFQLLRQEQLAGGPDSRQAWLELEMLNAGRLRLASKGLRREGDQLFEVDEQVQDAEGLYMAGQVAVLRGSPTTVASLHREVSAGAEEFRAARLEETGRWLVAESDGERPAHSSHPLDVAVVGMACIFPGSDDLEGYWQTVLSGADVITEVPAQRWDTDFYYDPEPGRPDDGPRSTSKWGAFLAPTTIDPIRFGIPPSALGSIDPAQLLALETASRSLLDAGYGHDAATADHSRTGVVFAAQLGGDVTTGVMLRTTLPSYLGDLPEELTEQLPVLTEDTFAGLLPNVVAGRIANRLNLGGANFTVDAACAGSLAAVDVACKHLSAGSADLMLCGGVDLHNSIGDYMMFSSVHALSPTGRARTFDSGADGTVLGEGVACVTLKRLADAEADGDRIYAVIKGVGAASDGRALGLTAPHAAGQRRAMDRAYRQAGVSPRQVGLVEAHGTGTIAGDRAELESLTGAFTEAKAAAGSCVLGSVKSQIGHTKSSAGLAGLIKATLAIHTGVQPPTGNLTRPSAAWDAERSPFAFLTAPRPWVAPAGERIAAVSAFGFGGTNFHLVVSGHDGSPEPRHALGRWPVELFCFRGADRAAAHRAIRTMLEELTDPTHGARAATLRERAATLAKAATVAGHPVQVAIIAEDIADLEQLLRRGLSGEHDTDAGLIQPAGPRPSAGQLPVAFLFPGQGSQRPNALVDLFVAFPELRQYLTSTGPSVDALFPPSVFDAAGRRAQAERIRDTSVAQPVLGMGGLAVHHLLGRLGVRPDLVAGHSYGELVALSVAGAFDPATLIELSHERASSIAAVIGDDPGTMVAVSAGVQAVRDVLAEAGSGDGVVLANHNAPEQIVIAGTTPAIEAAVEALRAAGLSTLQLPVACAFHSPLIAAAGARFGAAVGGRSVSSLRLPVWSNRTGAPYPTEPDQVRAELVAQISSPVLFSEQIEGMYADGARIFVEAGPGQALSRLVTAVLGSRPHLSVACDDPTKGGGLRSLLTAIGQLACAGVQVDLGWLFRGRESPHTRVDSIAAEREADHRWTADGQLVRDRAGACVPGGLTPARRIKELSMTPPDHQTPDRPGSGREVALADFLRVSRDMVAAQRDVMLAFLGDQAGGHLVWQPSGAEPLPASDVQPVAATAVPQAAADSTPGAPGLATAAKPPDLREVVLAVISERTGYPVDLLDENLDLESDLSIDSIKRAEVAGEVAIRLDLDLAQDESAFEPLVKARTVREMLTLLTGLDRIGAGQGIGVTPLPAVSVVPARSSEGPGVPSGGRPDRYVPQLVILDEPSSAETAVDRALGINGARFLVTGAANLVQAVSDRLHRDGAEVSTGSLEVDSLERSPDVDGLILLDGLEGTDGSLPPAAFELIKRALAAGLRWLLAVGSPDAASDGLAGMFRSIAREYPQTTVRYVEIVPGQASLNLEELVLKELSSQGPPVVVLDDGLRHAVEHAVAPLCLPLKDSRQDVQGAVAAEALALNRDSVVVLFGGGRGITATVARKLAQVSGCRIELIGRTPLPAEPESADTAMATDKIALRTLLARQSPQAAAAIEHSAGAILAGRELNSTMSALTTMGSRVRYHQLDVCDGGAVDSLLKALRNDYGRIDGLVYGAGVIEDGLLETKDSRSFSRVYDTKVAGAQAVLDGLVEHELQPRFVVLFGSIAAAYGSRGQSNYASANDALDRLGSRWSNRTGIRCLTVNWGPWAPVGQTPGMVTPELSREYARRGLGTIDPDQAAACLLHELAWGATDLDSVIYTCGMLDGSTR